MKNYYHVLLLKYKSKFSSKFFLNKSLDVNNLIYAKIFSSPTSHEQTYFFYYRQATYS